MSQLTVVAKIQAKPGLEIALHQELLRLIPPTLSESGCLNYTLHRSIEDPTLFLFYENWSSRDFWEQHMATQHIHAFQRNAKTLIKHQELFLMKLESPKG